MGILDTFRAVATLSATGLTAPVAVAGGDNAETLISRSRAARVAVDLAMSIASVRKAVHVIAGTLSTGDLIASSTSGASISSNDRRVRWLQHPDTDKHLDWTLRKTLTDLIWHDRSVWQITDRYIDGTISHADRVHPTRVDTLPDPRDPDRVAAWIIDGTKIDRAGLVIIDGGGVGGLQRYGYELLSLYGKLQAAAGRYAEAPHPHAILKNSGADLTDKEIDELLESWEEARSTRAVGYLNDVMEYQTIGWNAEELQLTEAREYAALETARLFGLPAKALDAKSGDSMTYANAVEARRDIAAALRPWAKPIESALSAATGTSVQLAVDDYTRDDPAARMTTWQTALTAGVLDLAEVRALEPLSRRYP